MFYNLLVLHIKKVCRSANCLNETGTNKVCRPVSCFNVSFLPIPNQHFSHAIAATKIWNQQTHLVTSLYLTLLFIILWLCCLFYAPILPLMHGSHLLHTDNMKLMTLLLCTHGYLQFESTEKSVFPLWKATYY